MVSELYRSSPRTGSERMSAFFNLMTYCWGTCMNEARYGRLENGLVIFYCKECRRKVE